MLGTANGALVHEAVHPCTALGRSFASTPEGCELLLLLLRQATAGMPEVEQRREQLPDAAQTGPPVARRAADEKARRVGARDRADSAAGHGWPVSGTRPPLAQSEAMATAGMPELEQCRSNCRMAGDRATGGVFLW